MNIKWHYTKDEVPEPNFVKSYLIAIKPKDNDERIQYEVGFYHEDLQDNRCFMLNNWDNPKIYGDVIAWAEFPILKVEGKERM